MGNRLMQFFKFDHLPETLRGVSGECFALAASIDDAFGGARWQVVDFGPGPQDSTRGYPFEGTEAECSAWAARANASAERPDRYACQEVPA